MSSRTFDLGDVLSVTTGRLVGAGHIGGVYEVLNFLHDAKLFTHQLPNASDEAQPYLESILPRHYDDEMQEELKTLSLWLTEADTNEARIYK